MQNLCQEKTLRGGSEVPLASGCGGSSLRPQEVDGECQAGHPDLLTPEGGSVMPTGPPQVEGALEHVKD